MKVNIKSSYIVKPSEPTWYGILVLSELDQTGTMMHVPTIYCYTTPSESIMQTLQTSLSQVLVHFYPLAGRLSWSATGSRLVLDCNANGVVLIEAESDAALADLGDFSPRPDFDQLIPSADYTAPIQETPLFMAQLTKFRCGGTSLGLAISHVVADGQGICNFLHEWARLACGKPTTSAPFLDRKVLLRGGDPPRRNPVFDYKQYSPPPLIVGESTNETEKKKETRVCILRLSKPRIDALKLEANGDNFNGANSRSYSRYEAITAHIWKCACKARNHKPEQPTNLTFCVDIRKRVDPPLPISYLGNAVIDVVAGGVSGDIISMPLERVAFKIRETIDTVTPEYISSAIDFLKTREDLITRQELPFSGNPNLSVISWMSLPLHGLDFGWGEEIHMGPGNHTGDGDILIIPSCDGDGSLLVAMCFQVDHIEDFKKCFYQDINN